MFRSHLKFIYLQVSQIHIALYGGKLFPHTLFIKVDSCLPHDYFNPNLPEHHTQVQPTVPAGKQLAAQCRINWYQYAGL